MKDGVTYVGNGTFTLKESLESCRKEGLITSEISKKEEIDFLREKS